MESKIRQQLQNIEKDLGSSKVDLPLSLKMKAAELILRLMVRRKDFGLFVIVGWRRKWQDHLDISDSKQDIFARHPINIMKVEPGEGRHRDVSATVHFDGAILIDKEGTIIHSGVFIEGLRPRLIAQKLNPGKFYDLSEQFGFVGKVHARHLSAISAS